MDVGFGHAWGMKPSYMATRSRLDKSGADYDWIATNRADRDEPLEASIRGRVRNIQCAGQRGYPAWSTRTSDRGGYLDTLERVKRRDAAARAWKLYQ